MICIRCEPSLIHVNLLCDATTNNTTGFLDNSGIYLFCDAPVVRFVAVIKLISYTYYNLFLLSSGVVKYNSSVNCVKENVTKVVVARVTNT